METAKELKICLTAAIALLIVAYGGFKLKDVALGPSIMISTPENGQTVKNSEVEVKGATRRISKLYLNGRQIFTDETGNFDEPLLLSAGYNIISVNAEDRFGRKVAQKIELVLD